MGEVRETMLARVDGLARHLEDAREQLEDAIREGKPLPVRVALEERIDQLEDERRRLLEQLGRKVSIEVV